MPSRPYHRAIVDMPRKSRLGGVLEETALVTDHAILHWSWLKPNHPPAVHAHEWDQTMYILEGTYEVTLDDTDVYECKAGDVLYIPGGVKHAGKVVGEQTIHVLQVFAPVHEDYLKLVDRAQFAPSESREVPMSDTVTPLDELLARHACEQILVRNNRNIDEGRAADNIAYYTSDATLTGSNGSLKGAEAILQVLKHRQGQEGRTTMHALSGFDFTLISADEAEAAGGLIRWLGTPETMEALPLLQQYNIRYVRIDGKWFIREHTVTRISAAGI